MIGHKFGEFSPTRTVPGPYRRTRRRRERNTLMSKSATPRALGEHEAKAVVRMLRVKPAESSIFWPSFIRGKKVATALARGSRDSRASASRPKCRRRRWFTDPVFCVWCSPACAPPLWLRVRRGREGLRIWTWRGTLSSPSCPTGWPWNSAGRREFAKLVADHLLSDGNRHVLVPVDHAEGQTDELRQDGRAAAPPPWRAAVSARTSRSSPTAAAALRDRRPLRAGADRPRRRPLYDGSLTEWSAHPDLPLVTG